MSIWRSIADTLRDEIARGHHPAGDRLPTEAALAARFGVNRHTVRHALSALAAEGLVRPRRGAGVFVLRAPVDYPLGRRVRFHHAIAVAGRVPGRQIYYVATRPADPAEAGALQIAPGDPVHVAEGVSLVDGEAVAVFRSVFPAAPLPDLPAALAAGGGVTAALARCGIADYTRASTRITARLADAVQAARLGVAEGAALIRTEALNLGPEGRPVEHGLAWWLAARVTLTVSGDQAE